MARGPSSTKQELTHLQLNPTDIWHPSRTVPNEESARDSAKAHEQVQQRPRRRRAACVGQDGDACVYKCIYVCL